MMSLIRSFKYAFIGIGQCFLYERNMRIHICVALYALWLASYYDFSRTQYAVILILCAMVLFAEMVNTAIEQLVNIKSPTFSIGAKAVKDIAAGAVLICAICSVIVGVMFYFDINVLKSVALDLITHPIKLAAFVLSLVLAVLFSKFGIFKKKI